MSALTLKVWREENESTEDLAGKLRALSLLAASSGQQFVAINVEDLEKLTSGYLWYTSWIPVDKVLEIGRALDAQRVANGSQEE